MVSEIDGKTLKEWLDSGKKIVIIDARAPQDFKKGHIAGAVSLLNADVEKKAEKLIDKGSVIVVYSNDADCPASGIVAKKLDSMGFGTVYDYNPSYADWVNMGYPVVK